MPTDFFVLCSCEPLTAEPLERQPTLGQNLSSKKYNMSWIYSLFALYLLQKKGALNIQAVLLLSALCSYALAGIHCYHC